LFDTLALVCHGAAFVTALVMAPLLLWCRPCYSSAFFSTAFTVLCFLVLLFMAPSSLCFVSIAIHTGGDG
jgi:hypothetical protein